MKRLIFLLTAVLLIAIPVFSQAVPIEPDNPVAAVVVDLSTFVGIVAFVSLVVTQLAKKIPAVEASKVLKILTSVCVGVATSFLSWWLGLADFLMGLIWWQVLIQGVLAGLTACGFYDLIKAALTGKKE